MSAIDTTKMNQLAIRYFEYVDNYLNDEGTIKQEQFLQLLESKMETIKHTTAYDFRRSMASFAGTMMMMGMGQKFTWDFQPDIKKALLACTADELKQLD